MSVSSISPRASAGTTKAPARRQPRSIPENAVSVRVPEMCAMLGVGPTKGAELIRTGAVKSVLIGRTRLVNVASIRALAGEDA